MVAAAAEDDNAEGRGGVESSVGLKVVCRCCCFISTTTFTLKSGESICCAALRRLSKGSIFYHCRCLQDMSALGKCSFYAHTKDTQRYTTTLIPLRKSSSSWVCCLFVRAYVPGFWADSSLATWLGKRNCYADLRSPFFAAAFCNSNRDSWRGSCAVGLGFLGSTQNFRCVTNYIM